MVVDSMVDGGIEPNLTQNQEQSIHADSGLGKRTADQAGLFSETPRRSKRIATGGGGGGDGHGEGGEEEEDNYAEARGGRGRGRGGGRGRGRGRGSGKVKPPCPRGGDKPRVTRPARSKRIAASVQGMLKQLQEEGGADENEGKGKGKGKRTPAAQKKVTIWRIDGEPPRATRQPALRVVQLAMIGISLDLQNTLADFLLQIQPPTQSDTNEPQIRSLGSLIPSSLFSPSPTPFVAALKRCGQLETKGILNNFEAMKSYVEAALYIQWQVLFLCIKFTSTHIMPGVKTSL